MRFGWIISLAAAAVACAQVGSIGVKPIGPAVTNSAGVSGGFDRRGPAAGPPLLGFIAGPSPVELRAIVGNIARPQLGGQIAIPMATKMLYLPPRQAYALLEKTSDEPLTVWPLRGVATNAPKRETPIPGVMAHPDLVVFSPRGMVAGLYSKAGGTFQVVINLPVQPFVSKQLPMSGQGAASQFVVSDDAAVVVVSFPDGRLMSSLDGGQWTPLPLGFNQQAWSFLPNTHDLVLSDQSQKIIVLLTHVEDSSRSVRILAQDVQADRLAVTRDGEQLMAANSASRQVWAIDLNTGTVVPTEGIPNIELLSTLRDGFTFLLSGKPELTVLRLQNATPRPLSTVGSNIKAKAPTR